MENIVLQSVMYTITNNQIFDSNNTLVYTISGSVIKDVNDSIVYNIIDKFVISYNCTRVIYVLLTSVLFLSLNFPPTIHITYLYKCFVLYRLPTNKSLNFPHIIHITYGTY